MNLTELANKYGSDKGITSGDGHGYTLIYEKILGPLKNEPINILEIGINRFECDKAPSLMMWRDYFPKATIYGFDIRDFSGLNSSRIKIFQGDQRKKNHLMRVTDVCSEFDVIIDDGSHGSLDQQASFWYLFAYVKEKGLYIIEDLHLQPLDEVASKPPILQTQHFIKTLGWHVTLYCSEKLAVIKKTAMKAGRLFL